MSDAYVPVWRRFPPVVYLLLGAFALIQLMMSLSPSAQQDEIFYRFALIPQRFRPGGADSFAHWYDAISPLIGHAFLHGGWLHLGMNCLAFVQVAPFLALRLGQVRFLILFVVSALGGAGLYLALHTQNPMVGASGAICGLFAAYFLGVRPTPVEALADPGVRFAILFFLGINVVLVGLSGLPIAWQAHLGGFIAGAIAYPLLAPRLQRAIGPWG